MGVPISNLQLDIHCHCSVCVCVPVETGSVACGVSPSLKAVCLSTSGMLLLTACTEGRTFNLFRILPHPSLSSETCVQHLYVLRRGETTSIVRSNHHLL